MPVALGGLDECALVGMEPGEETRGSRQGGRIERDPHPAEEAEHRLLGVGARGRLHRRRASGLDGEQRGEVGPVRGRAGGRRRRKQRGEIGPAVGAGEIAATPDAGLEEHGEQQRRQYRRAPVRASCREAFSASITGRSRHSGSASKMLQESFATGKLLVQATSDTTANELVKAVAADYATAEGRKAASEGLKAKFGGGQPGDIKAKALDALGQAGPWWPPRRPAMPPPTRLGSSRSARTWPRPPRKAAFSASAACR